MTGSLLFQHPPPALPSESRKRKPWTTRRGGREEKNSTRRSLLFGSLHPSIHLPFVCHPLRSGPPFSARGEREAGGSEEGASRGPRGAAVPLPLSPPGGGSIAFAARGLPKQFSCIWIYVDFTRAPNSIEYALYSIGAS